MGSFGTESEVLSPLSMSDASRPCLAAWVSPKPVVSSNAFVDVDGPVKSPFLPFEVQRDDAPCFPSSHAYVADLVPLPFTLPETSSSAVSAKPESKIGSSSPVEIVASPADISMQCHEDVLWRCPDEVSTGLLWPYPDVFQKACDVLAFTPHSLYGWVPGQPSGAAVFFYG